MPEVGSVQADGEGHVRLWIPASETDTCEEVEVWLDANTAWALGRLLSAKAHREEVSDEPRR